MENDFQRQLVFHCTGHVVGAYLNRPIAGDDEQGIAWIDQDNVTCGFTGMQARIRTDKADAVLALCGPVAERLSRGLAVTRLIANPQTSELLSASRWMEHEDGEDIQFVGETLERLGFPKDLDVFRKLQMETRTILTDRNSWSAVERIAGVLIREGQIEMDAAFAIVDSTFRC